MRLSLVVMFALSALAAAPAPPPGGERPPDAERERATLTCSLNQMLLAVNGEDADLVRALLYADDDVDRKLADAEARRTLASVRFDKALRERFGGVDNDFWSDLLLVNPATFFNALMPEWQINGETATASIPDQPEIRFPRLRRIRGIWKIEIEAVGAKPGGIRVSDALAQARAIDEIAANIRAGKYGGLVQVKAAMSEKQLVRNE